MKKFVSLALIAASLTVSAKALIIGADVGYLLDDKEEFISARIGHALKSDTSLSHQIELELGYSSHSETIAPLGAPIKATSKITPVTLNYRAESIAANKLGYYFGVGAGIARTGIKFAGSGVPTVSDNSTSLALQGFVGLSYQVSAAAKLHLGAKYIWIDEVKLLGIKADVGDDVAITGGISVKF